VSRSGVLRVGLVMHGDCTVREKLLDINPYQTTILANKTAGSKTDVLRRIG